MLTQLALRKNRVHFINRRSPSWRRPVKNAKIWNTKILVPVALFNMFVYIVSGLRWLARLWRFLRDKISNVNTLLLCCIYQCHVVCINVMFVYINVVLYTSMLCLCILMSCCIHQCYIKGVHISFVRCKSSFKCPKSMLSVIHLSCNVASRSDIVSFVWESGVHPSVTVVIIFDKTKTCSIRPKEVRIHPWPSWTGSGNDFCEQEVISFIDPATSQSKIFPWCWFWVAGWRTLVIIIADLSKISFGAYLMP